MEPLERSERSFYGYTPHPCGFSHIAEELERMAGCDVNVTLEDGMGGAGIIRTHGCLGLAEKVPNYSPQRVGYSLGDDESEEFQICEEKFTRGQLVPGMVLGRDGAAHPRRRAAALPA